MEVKAFLVILTMFLVNSCILSTTAVPTSRSSLSIEEDPLAHNIPAQGVLDTKDDGNLSEVEGGYEKGGTNMENPNYEKPKANHHHDGPTGMETKDNTRLLGAKGVYFKGTVDVESADYTDPGSNPRHDPKTPPSS